MLRKNSIKSKMNNGSAVPASIFAFCAPFFTLPRFLFDVPFFAPSQQTQGECRGDRRYDTGPLTFVRTTEIDAGEFLRSSLIVPARS